MLQAWVFTGFGAGVMILGLIVDAYAKEEPNKSIAIFAMEAFGLAMFIGGLTQF